MNKFEERQTQRRERIEAAADKARTESNMVYRRARQMADAIPGGQPILVGHHSEGRDRRYRARIHSTFGKSFALQDKADRLAEKAASVGTGGISSDDPEAIHKLRLQLGEHERKQDLMREANRVLRTRKTPEAQIAALIELGFSEAEAPNLLKPDFMRRVGFPDYALKNNNANIRRIKVRIQELEAASQRQAVEIVGNGYIYREDIEDNRAMFLFGGKPSEAVRKALKAHGFKWSPSRTGQPWVRQLTGNARWAAQSARKELEKLAADIDNINQK